MKKGLILVNAYAESTETNQTLRFCEEFQRRGVAIDVKRNNFFPLAIKNGKLDSIGLDYDFCLYLDKDKYIAAMLEGTGMRLFNRARAIELCDDKMTTHIALAGSVPMPDTLPGTLCYDAAARVSPELVDSVISRLGLPVIVKQSYGSLGKGVFKADTRDELLSLCEKVKLNSHLFQKYIAASHGKDMRVIVIGKKTLGGILRISDCDFRSNIGLGGHARRVDVPNEIKLLAERAADILDLDYCGIDFLLGPEPLLCEVNSNAFFEGFEKTTGINVAGAYADLILASI